MKEKLEMLLLKLASMERENAKLRSTITRLDKFEVSVKDLQDAIRAPNVKHDSQDLSINYASIVQRSTYKLTPAPKVNRNVVVVSLEDGFHTGIIRRERPKLMVYDALHDMDNAALIEAIWAQNLEGNLSRDKIDETLKIHHAYRNGHPNRQHITCEVDSALRKLLLEKKRLIGYRSCRVTDNVQVTRCFQCPGLGHVVKYCKEVHPICGHCTKAGHKKGTAQSKTVCPNLRFARD